MSFDLQMARGSADGEFNLAIGEPFFLQQILLPAVKLDEHPQPLTYPQVGGEDQLKEQLHRLYPQYQYVVVTNGCKQAIEAAFYAFRKVEMRDRVFHHTPYWPSYPTLAANRGLQFNTVSHREMTIFVATSPNNPDGTELPANPLWKKYRYGIGPVWDLWDAAYAHPMYGYQGVPPEHRVAVFSAAKLLGLSGLRVGWLCTNDQKLAEKAAYFVEITTSGVSVSSQVTVAAYLRAFSDPNQMMKLTDLGFEARAALMTNGDLFYSNIGHLVSGTRGVPASGQGMFAWFKARNPEVFDRALKQAKVKVVTGDACGEKEPGWYRMSMGQMPEYTEQALRAVRSAYEEIS
jgi:aspartate/methionine/tyrosine aminotransferase